MELDVKGYKHGFRICAIFDLGKNGEAREDTKRFIVIGPNSEVYYPTKNTISAAVAKATTLDDEAEEKRLRWLSKS